MQGQRKLIKQCCQREHRIPQTQLGLTDNQSPSVRGKFLETTEWLLWRLGPSPRLNLPSLPLGKGTNISFFLLRGPLRNPWLAWLPTDTIDKLTVACLKQRHAYPMSWDRVPGTYDDTLPTSCVKEVFPQLVTCCISAFLWTSLSLCVWSEQLDTTSSTVSWDKRCVILVSLHRSWIFWNVFKVSF